jgi:hypothetical protein
VQLQAVTLEPLHLERSALDTLLTLGRDREAKDRQPAVLLPVRADAPADAEARLGKAALVALGLGRGSGQQPGHDGYDEQTEDPEDSSYLHVQVVLLVCDGVNAWAWHTPGGNPVEGRQVSCQKRMSAHAGARFAYVA